MSDEEIWELMHKDVDSADAYEAIDELLARKPKAEALCDAIESIMDGDGKTKYQHLSWPATVMHIMARACNV